MHCSVCGFFAVVSTHFPHRISEVWPDLISGVSRSFKASAGQPAVTSDPHMVNTLKLAFSLECSWMQVRLQNHTDWWNRDDALFLVSLQVFFLRSWTETPTCKRLQWSFNSYQDKRRAPTSKEALNSWYKSASSADSANLWDKRQEVK